MLTGHSITSPSHTLHYHHHHHHHRPHDQYIGPGLASLWAGTGNWHYRLQVTAIDGEGDSSLLLQSDAPVSQTGGETSCGPVWICLCHW